MAKGWISHAFSVVLAALAMMQPAAASADKLAISCGAVGTELRLCREGVESWSQQTGVAIEIVSTPNSSTERLALYQQFLAAGASDIDIMQVDVIWPGILAPHLADISQYIPGAASGHMPALITNNTVDEKLVALPWFTAAGVLYYRKDLLAKHGFAPPATWGEMTRTAKAVMEAERAAGDMDLWGFVWQGKAYEGLTCNALEWLDSSGGGTIVAADGSITVDNERAVAALSMAAGWVGTISPPGILNYDEEASRGFFQSGNAVFMRNWPYAWSLSQSDGSAIKGKVAVAPLPKGDGAGRHAATLGGWGLAVSKYSKDPQRAAELAAFLTSSAEQKRRVLAASYNPTRPTLYADPDILAANPFIGTLEAAFADAVARPSTVTGDKYNRVSAQFWAAVHGVLAGRQKAEPALAGLAAGLDRISRRGRW